MDLELIRKYRYELFNLVRKLNPPPGYNPPKPAHSFELRPKDFRTEADIDYVKRLEIFPSRDSSVDRRDPGGMPTDYEVDLASRAYEKLFGSRHFSFSSLNPEAMERELTSWKEKIIEVRACDEEYFLELRNEAEQAGDFCHRDYKCDLAPETRAYDELFTGRPLNLDELRQDERDAELGVWKQEIINLHKEDHEFYRSNNNRSQNTEQPYSGVEARDDFTESLRQFDDRNSAKQDVDRQVTHTKSSEDQRSDEEIFKSVEEDLKLLSLRFGRFMELRIYDPPSFGSLEEIEESFTLQSNTDTRDAANLIDQFERAFNLDADLDRGNLSKQADNKKLDFDRLSEDSRAERDLAFAHDDIEKVLFGDDAQPPAPLLESQISRGQEYLNELEIDLSPIEINASQNASNGQQSKRIENGIKNCSDGLPPLHTEDHSIEQTMHLNVQRDLREQIEQTFTGQHQSVDAHNDMSEDKDDQRRVQEPNREHDGGERSR